VKSTPFTEKRTDTPAKLHAGFCHPGQYRNGRQERHDRDRHERRTLLLAYLADGSTESLCRVIGGLHAYRKVRALNESDQSLLKQARNALLGEWGYVLSITPAQAEHELQHLLACQSLPVAK